MIKKFGMVTVGVTAGLLVAAPLASAHEAPAGEGQHHTSGHCSFVGGTGEGSSGGHANGEIAGVGGASVGGIGGDNIANIANCSSFLNDNVNGNHLGDTELPSLPDLGDLGGFSGLPSYSTPGVSTPGL